MKKGLADRPHQVYLHHGLNIAASYMVGKQWQAVNSSGVLMRRRQQTSPRYLVVCVGELHLTIDSFFH